MNIHNSILTNIPTEYDIVSQLTILSLALEGIVSLAAHTQIEEADVAPLIKMVNSMKQGCIMELNE